MVDAPRTEHIPLERFLWDWAQRDDLRRDVAGTVIAITTTAGELSRRIQRGALDGDLAATTLGNGRKEIDLWAHCRLIDALTPAPVAALLSEEAERSIALNPGAPLAVSFDPLDGTNNIDTNASVGTLFSVLPTGGRIGDEIFLQPGTAQLASGYVIYGPQCILTLTVGEGTHQFTFDRDEQKFRLTARHLAIPYTSSEYAINASNYRFWSDAIQSYIDDCISGREGPRSEDVNMRWIGSMVAECHRILVRGGVYLYPRDSRHGYEHGRLRLLYEANPMAFLIEQAKGKAIDGFTRAMELVPTTLHQRTPLMFGSADEVDRIHMYKTNAHQTFERSPLFGRRGLLKR